MLQGFVMHLSRAAEQRVSVPAGTPDAVKKNVHLHHQCFEKRARIRLDQRKQGAQRRSGGATLFTGILGDHCLTTRATLRNESGLRFDARGNVQHVFRVAAAGPLLLLFEKIQQSAIVGEFGAKTLSDQLPVFTHA